MIKSDCIKLFTVQYMQVIIALKKDVFVREIL